MWLYFANNVSADSLMRGCVHASVSIVWLFVLSVFPFLISALAVLFSFPLLIYLVCFVRALIFGFVLAGLECGWGDSAWLVRFCLLFEDCLLIPTLYLFCRRNLLSRDLVPWGESVCLVLWVGLTVIIRDRLVDPFLAEVLIL